MLAFEVWIRLLSSTKRFSPPPWPRPAAPVGDCQVDRPSGVASLRSSGQGPRMKSGPDPHHRHRFPAESISHAGWLYHTFSLSFRDIELLLARRGHGRSNRIRPRFETSPALDSSEPTGSDGCNGHWGPV